MLVKDQFKRISWDELFEFSFKEEVTEVKVERNPFMKKQFNSINFHEEKSVGKPINTESYSTKSNNNNKGYTNNNTNNSNNASNNISINNNNITINNNNNN